MLKHLLLIAGGVVSSCLLLLFFMVAVNAYGAITGSFLYPIPESVVGLITTVFGIACSVLSVAGICAFRNEYEYEQSQGIDLAFTPEPDILTIEAEKEPLDVLYPVPADDGIQLRDDQ